MTHVHVTATPLNPLTPAQIERQIRWECAASQEGVERYRRSLAEVELADTQPGIVAMRDMFQSLEPALANMQADFVATLTGTTAGPRPAWWSIACLLPPDKLAFLTIRSVAGLPAKRADQGRTFTSVAFAIAAAIRTEVEFENWQRREAEAKDADPLHVDLAKVILSKVQNPSPRDFSRWRRKLSNIEREEWDRSTRVKLGAALLTKAIEHSGGWLECRNVPTKGKTERRVYLSAAALEAIADINSKLEVNRPYLLPMLCPPKPWRRTNA